MGALLTDDPNLFSARQEAAAFDLYTALYSSIFMLFHIFCEPKLKLKPEGLSFNPLDHPTCPQNDDQQNIKYQDCRRACKVALHAAHVLSSLRNRYRIIWMIV
ncbi:hypothetical protein ACVNS2_08940 [Paenibacillus caseinilyticus]|uniref:hypothetical protein n=1 Tax=Paenibacillus mucilaginosus TaxID=61624 RepID=UPI003B9838A2